MKTIVFGLALLGLGVVAGAFAPGLSDGIRHLASVAGLAAAPGSAAPAKDAHGHGGGSHSEKEKEGEEGKLKLSAEQIAAAKIEVAAAGPGTLAMHLTVPGVVQPDPDRVARIAGRVVGTVAELKKRLGDSVEKGEAVAVIDSREVAEAKSEYFAARTNVELQQTLFEREQSLWDKRISAENLYLRARTTFTEAQLRVELAVQKLQALGLGEDEIAALERRTPVRTASTAASGVPAGAPRPLAGLQRYTVRSPISGQVVERLVNLGAPMGGEGENKELYVVADLSAVWIELAVPVGDLASIRQGQPVAIAAGDGPTSDGRIVFVSPILNPETRSARVIASVANEGMTWRPGSYVTAKVATAEEKVDVRLPKAALQTIAGEQVVFVRTSDGFEKREVATGKADDRFTEIVFGLDPGEEVAVANSFVLKAELGKAEAEHAH